MMKPLISYLHNSVIALHIRSGSSLRMTADQFLFLPCLSFVFPIQPVRQLELRCRSVSVVQTYCVTTTIISTSA